MVTRPIYCVFCPTDNGIRVNAFVTQAYLWLQFGNVGVCQTLRYDRQTDSHARNDVTLKVGQSAESRNSDQNYHLALIRCLNTSVYSGNVLLEKVTKDNRMNLCMVQAYEPYTSRPNGKILGKEALW